LLSFCPKVEGPIISLPIFPTGWNYKIKKIYHKELFIMLKALTIIPILGALESFPKLSLKAFKVTPTA